jgi:hypothetical protein
VIIDEESRINKWEMKDVTDQLVFSDTIYFGGSKDDGVANDIGFAGCLKEPYVGLVAALTHLSTADGNKVRLNNTITLRFLNHFISSDLHRIIYIVYPYDFLIPVLCMCYTSTVLL